MLMMSEYPTCRYFQLLVAVLVFLEGIRFAGAQPVGKSISADGALPNTNAMLDVQSPATGDGKGLLIPRLTQNQRTNADVTLPGGLLQRHAGNERVEQHDDEERDMQVKAVSPPFQRRCFFSSTAISGARKGFT